MSSEYSSLSARCGDTTQELSQGRAEERADLLAYLDQRIENAATMAARSPEFEDQARIIRRQLSVVADDVRAGLHEGKAGVRAYLIAAGQAGVRA